MSGYTPTTDEVETAFHEFASRLETESPGEYAEAPEFADWQEAMAGFRRWLAAHDAEVAAKALEDAADALRRGEGPIDIRRTDEWLESLAGRLRYPS